MCWQNHVTVRGGFLEEVACQLDLGKRRSRREMEFIFSRGVSVGGGGNKESRGKEKNV